MAKKKKSSCGAGGCPVPAGMPDDKEYQTRDDVDTMLRFHGLRQDKARHGRASERLKGAAQLAEDYPSAGVVARSKSARKETRRGR